MQKETANLIEQAQAGLDLYNALLVHGPNTTRSWGRAELTPTQRAGADAMVKAGKLECVKTSIRFYGYKLVTAVSPKPVSAVLCVLKTSFYAQYNGRRFEILRTPVDGGKLIYTLSIDGVEIDFNEYELVEFAY
jgi:hypothetical protein